MRQKGGLRTFELIAERLVQKGLAVETKNGLVLTKQGQEVIKLYTLARHDLNAAPRLSH